jgi:hypothetical protein
VAGYSHRTLTEKLGIKVGATVLIAYEPADVDLESLLRPLPDDVRLRRRKGTQPLDVVVCFAESRHQVGSRLPKVAETIDRAGAVWLIWPKKSSDRFKEGPRDLGEDVVRDAALELGLVDVKVCAVDDTWSGLKLVWRLSNR